MPQALELKSMQEEEESKSVYVGIKNRLSHSFFSVSKTTDK